MSYNSKYTGLEVEDLLDKVEDGRSAAYPILKPSSLPSALQPNTYYDLGQRAGFIIDLAPYEPGIVNEYIFRFTIADSGSELTLPDNIIWANGKIPPMTIGKNYEVSIIDNYAVFVEF